MAKQNNDDNNMQQKIFWGIVLVLIVAVIFGIFKLSNEGKRTTNDPFEITSQDHVKGNRDAAVTLIEYSDFQCPACRGYFPLIKQLNSDFPENLRIVYRHFPLTSIHPHAIPAAKASEAAGMQDRFWEMHDLIFDNQSNWTNSSDVEEIFESYADILKLDLEKYRADFDSKAVSRKVSGDRALALRQNLRGTPSFFLQGRRLENVSDYTTLKGIIEQEIIDAGAQLPEDTTELEDGTSNENSNDEGSQSAQETNEQNTNEADTTEESTSSTEATTQE